MKTHPVGYYEKKWIEYFEEQPFRINKKLDKLGEVIINLLIAFIPLYISAITLIQKSGIRFWIPVIINLILVTIYFFRIIPETSLTTYTNFSELQNSINEHIRDKKRLLYVFFLLYVALIILSSLLLLFY